MLPVFRSLIFWKRGISYTWGNMVSHFTVTTMLEVGKTRASYWGSPGRWPHSVGCHLPEWHSIAHDCPRHASCPWPFPRNPFLSLIPFSTSCPISLSQPLIYHSWQAVEQSYFWVYMCPSSSCGLGTCPGSDYLFGLRVPVPGCDGHLANVLCCWLVVTTDHSAISALLAIWGGLLASWASPGTLFISENSTCCPEVRFSQLNADVLFWGNKSINTKWGMA